MPGLLKFETRICLCEAERRRGAASLSRCVAWRRPWPRWAGSKPSESGAGSRAWRLRGPQAGEQRRSRAQPVGMEPGLAGEEGSRRRPGTGGPRAPGRDRPLRLGQATRQLALLLLFSLPAPSWRTDGQEAGVSAGPGSQAC